MNLKLNFQIIFMDIEKILAEKGHYIDKELKKAFPKKGITNLYDAVWYHMGTGGKRIRPVLAIATCEALGGNSKKVVPFAAACEVLHNWLLIHDDIEDGDRVRRDKPAVWVKFGLGHGINAGDLMAQKVFELILSSDLKEKTIFRLIKTMTDTAIKTAEGQAMDMNLRGNDNPTEKEYMEMVTGKTAYYMTVPITGGAIVADASEKTIKKIIEFGMRAGPAFQIADDILDLTSGKGRGEIGRDIKEGKRSLLAIHCIKKCSKDEKEKLIKILNKSPESTTNAEVLYVKSLFEKYGSIKYARKKAEELIKKAKKTTEGMPPKLGKILIFFADYLVKRKK